MNLNQTQKVLSTIRRVRAVRNEPNLIDAIRRISDRGVDLRRYEGLIDVTFLFMEALEHPSQYAELEPHQAFMNSFLDEVDEHEDAGTDSILNRVGDDWLVSTSAAAIYREHRIEPHVFSLQDIVGEYELGVKFLDEYFAL